MYVYKHQNCKFDRPFHSFQGKHFFIGKSNVCELTEFSGAGDSFDFDGNTILLQCKDNEYVHISGFEIFIFKTDDRVIDYISLMGNNMCPYTNAIGKKYTYFISIHCKFIENGKIEAGTLLSNKQYLSSVCLSSWKMWCRFF